MPKTFIAARNFSVYEEVFRIGEPLTQTAIAALKAIRGRWVKLQEQGYVYSEEEDA